MEHSFIAWLQQRVSQLPKPRLGIGDDAAWIDAPQGCIVTTDSLCEGTHFKVAECGPRAVGRKLAGVNLSDIAAMAAEPRGLFLSLCLPRPHAASYACEIAEGVLEMATQFETPLAGGDTNVWDGPLVVHMTAIGEATDRGCWKRSGAQIGDRIFVTGSLGGSILGKHLQFEPRIRLARHLRDHFTIHAAADISDGLGVDLQNIIAASRCGACIDLDAIPISNDAMRLSDQTGRPAKEHAWGDGEDFELVFTVSADEAQRLPDSIDGVSLTNIGEIVSRTGLWTREGKNWKQVPPKGYIHR